MPAPRLLAFAGSTRKASFNKRLAVAAGRLAAEHGAEVTQVDLREYPLPLYDGDLEGASGIPDNADRLFNLLKSHDAFLIASPEYNGSISGVLKNMIDWVSRPREGELSLAAFSGRTAGIMSASPGPLGGLRGLVHLRAILGNIGMLVIPEQVAVGTAHEALSADGIITDDKMLSRVESVVQSLVTTTARLKGEAG